ncbi:MAG TPA: ABC transporter ATP-binding protein [Candidatus Gemmiger faecigallinarum]|nr:ABC transporter ATP-binding protein [Candidatus Gemmiger faecigallinarum]
MKDPILQVRDLCKVYGAGGSRVAALDHVSLTVRRGEFVSIVGPSGSGKSTLLHILGGVDKPTAGQVLVDGVDLSTLDETRLAVFRRRQIGLVYQFYNLIPVLTVAENLTLPLLLDHRRPDAAQVRSLAVELGIADRMDALPGQLSGGQQQRVSIGRALLTRPALVLADEPTGNLDRKNSAAIVELLKGFHRKYAQTLILITHDPEIALQAGRVLSLEDGRIVKDEVIRP